MADDRFKLAGLNKYAFLVSRGEQILPIGELQPVLQDICAHGWVSLCFSLSLFNLTSRVLHDL